MHESSSLTPSSLPVDGDVAQRAGDRQTAGECLTNWAGNLEYGTRRVHYPASVEEVQEVVVGSPAVRALGTRHSFSEISDTGGTLVSLRQMDGVVALDRAAC
jgi:xylitol oxidase